MIRPKLFLLLTLSVFAAAVAPAQTCSGNEDFYGAYLYTAANNRPLPAGPPPAPSFSATPVGRLLANIRAQTPFSATGRIIADGLGGVFAAPADANVITTQIGRYAVNGDCTVAMALYDGFTSEVSPLGVQVQRGLTAFEGVLQNRGDEANFAESGAGWATTLTLARPYLAQGCTNAALSGVFGIAGSGIEITRATESEPASPAPLSLLGRTVADGAGNFYLDTPALESRLPKRQILGAYTVEPDCTGRARLVTDKRILNISFILLRDGVRFGEFNRAAMRFAFVDPNLAGLGTAR